MKLTLYCLDDKGLNELQNLEQQGILESVVSSDWAAPVVVVPKMEGLGYVVITR